jgi:hypothetical protein
MCQKYSNPIPDKFLKQPARLYGSTIDSTTRKGSLHAAKSQEDEPQHGAVRVMQRLYGSTIDSTTRKGSLHAAKSQQGEPQHGAVRVMQQKSNKKLK